MLAALEGAADRPCGIRFGQKPGCIG